MEEKLAIKNSKAGKNAKKPDEVELDPTQPIENVPIKDAEWTEPVMPANEPQSRAGELMEEARQKQQTTPQQ